MIECFKYLKGIYKVNCSFLVLYKISKTRGHSLKLKKSISTNSSRHYFFANRCINAWNSLNEETVMATDINTFKCELDKFWKEHMYKNDFDWYLNPRQVRH